jgi:hypothetical protein
VTKENQRQGMSELLAKQRTAPPLTPSEAARRRRSGRPEPAPDSVDTPSQEDRPVSGIQPPEDLAPADETQAGAGIANQDVPGPVRRAVSCAARNKGTLLAAACAAAVAVLCWRAAGATRSAWPARRT